MSSPVRIQPIARLVAMILLLAGAPLKAADYASPPIILEAQKVIPADQLKGSNFRVDAKVRNDGMINVYSLETDSGTLKVESSAELQIRVAELHALVVMEELDRTEVFKDAVVGGVKATGQGIKALATDPVDTTKEMAKGTGQFLSNIGQALVGNDPHQDNALKVALGYDVAKRQFAYEFGINPYTEFEPVVDRLGEISRAAVAGGLTPKLALSSADLTLATVAQVSGTMRGMQLLVRDNPPNKLREINHDKLRAMGLSEELTDAFLDNYNYDPYEETLLIGELESLKSTGLDVFIARADLATEKSTALYYRLMAQMIGGYQRNVGPVEAILETGRVLHVKRKDGSLVVLAPLDYVFWTENLAAMVDQFEQSLAADAFAGSKELWVTGQIGDDAREQFEKRGWKLQEKASLALSKP